MPGLCGKADPPHPLSPTVQALVQVCVDAAAKSLKLLGKLHDKNLLETFLPFDLEYTFAAVFALRLVSAVVPRELIQIPSCTDMARKILGDYIARGNRIAVFRQAELDALDCLLSRLCSLNPVAVPINFSMPEPSGVSGSSLKDQSMISDHHLDSTLDGNSSAGGDWGGPLVGPDLVSG